MEVSGKIMLIAGAFPDAALRPNLSKTFSRDHTEYPTGYLQEVAKLWTVRLNICLHLCGNSYLCLCSLIRFRFLTHAFTFQKTCGIPSLPEVRNWRESYCKGFSRALGSIVQALVLLCHYYPYSFMEHTGDQSENSISVNLMGKLLKLDNTEIDLNWSFWPELL